MTITYRGNFIIIRYDIGDPSVPITLRDGYSFETLVINALNNISVIYDEIVVTQNMHITFPPINSKSPCLIKPILLDSTKPGIIRFSIEKFGQIPDAHYFDNAFEPILVTGDDGKEYNVMPSDQFK